MHLRNFISRTLGMCLIFVLGACTYDNPDRQQASPQTPPAMAPLSEAQVPALALAEDDRPPEGDRERNRACCGEAVLACLACSAGVTEKEYCALIPVQQGCSQLAK